jgi:hypothetical protein
MKIGPRISSLLTVAALVLLVTAAAQAQGPEGKRRREGPPPGAMFDFLGVREASEGKVVKGMPYRAEAVTEVSQSLADGNRITRRTTAAVARDSEGRTRRETSLAALGPLAPHDAPRLVFIHDPVAGTSYVLEPDSRTARKLGVHHAQRKAGPGVRFEAPVPEGGPGPDMAFRKRPHEMGEGRWPRQTENLGTQAMEGVDATGTRTTVTIPEAAIGNAKPITIVSERWFSPELQVVVSSTHRDPRFGETTYRLTGIVRGEPEKSLFDVPGDYTVREGPPDTTKFRRAPDAPEQDQ